MKSKNKTVKKERELATLVCFLLDRTGSMQSAKDETIRGFNAYIKEMREKLPKSARFTMMQFDSQSMEMLYERAEFSEVKDLTPETYQPRANTPLYDAMGKLINVVREKTASCGSLGCKYKVIFVSLTDGQENASSEWTFEKINALIKDMENAYKWTFAHIGVGISGWQAGNTLFKGTQSFSNVARASHKGMDKAMNKMAGASLIFSAKVGGQSVTTDYWGKADADLDED
jgi:uncharacterized protein YegL